jgi:hypothetical protein
VGDEEIAPIVGENAHGLVSVRCGTAMLKMNIASFPFDPAAVAAQRALHERLATAVGDHGTLTVNIRNPGDDGTL